MGKPSQTFRDLIVWQKAHAFVLEVYRTTEAFPKKEVFGLSSQFRRAAISVPANIADGFKKRGKADKLRFYNIAQGSVEECQYYLILAHDLKYVDTTSATERLNEVGTTVEKLRWRPGSELLTTSY